MGEIYAIYVIRGTWKKGKEKRGSQERERGKGRRTKRIRGGITIE